MTWDPQTQCTGYYDRWQAASLALSDGAPVSSWSSITTGVTLTATGGAQPTYIATAINSLPAVSFDGVSDYLRNSDGTSGFLAGVSGWTVYLVGSYTVSGNRTALFITNPSPATNARTNLRWMSGSADHQSRSSSADGTGFRVTGAATETASTVMVLCGTTDLANGDMWVYSNGTLRASNTSLTFGASSTTGSPFRINFGSFGTTTPGDFHDGYICEVWVFHAVHTTTDRARFHSYVQDKYGITVADYVASATNVTPSAAPASLTSSAVTVVTGDSASPTAAPAPVSVVGQNPTTSVSVSTSPTAAVAPVAVDGFMATTTTSSSLGPAGGAGSITLRLYDASGDFQTLLPTIGAVELDTELNTEGAGTLRYPRSGTGAGTLMSLVDGYVGVWFDGAEIFTFLLEDDEDDEANVAGDARQVVVGGRGTLALLERGVTLPPGGVGTTPIETSFVNATPGKIMIDLLNAVKALGCLTAVTTSFTAATDSFGNPWTKVIDIRYDAGKDLLTIAKDLSAQGLCDLRMRGLTFDMYNQTTVLGVDRPAVYVRRPHATKAPRKRSRRNLRTDFLVIGENGVNTIRSDGAAITTYGRRIGYIGQGNTETSATLNTIGDQALAEKARPTRSYVFDLVHDHPTCPKAFVDFFLGDYIRTDYAMSEVDTYEPMRVRAIAASWDTNGTVGVSVELNDRFLEAILDLKKRIEGVVHGTVTNVSGGPPQQPTPDDSTIPNAPASVSVSTGLGVNPEGISFARAEVSWPAVTTNTDGSSFNDFGPYRVRYRLPSISGSWAGLLATTGTSVVFNGLPTGATFQAGVVATDSSNNWSNETVSNTITLPVDSTPPPTPSTPTATAMLGGIRIYWNGRDNTNAVMPGDFKHVQVHVSATNGFTPDTTTMWGTISGGAGVAWLTGYPYGTAQYIRLIAVDYTGNISPASAQVSATPVRVTGADIKSGTIGFDAIAFKDLGNLVTDGSFENTEIDSQRITENGTAISYVADVAAPHGGRYARITLSTAPGLLRRLWLLDDMQITGGEKFWVRYKYRRSVGSNGTLSVAINVQLADTTFSTLRADATVADGAWQETSTYLTTPVTGRFIDIYLRAGTDATTGTIDFDMVEVRRVTNTELIDDLAVTNAKIASLAVDDAKVANMSVGKLTAGTLSADVTVSARIKTANTGARAEMDSAGFKVFNSSGVPTMTATGSTISITGEILTGSTGRRLVLNPGNTGLAEIRYYPDSGTDFAYINVYEGLFSAVLGLNSGASPTDHDAQWSLRLASDYTYLFRNSLSASGDQNGPWLYMSYSIEADDRATIGSAPITQTSSSYLTVHRDGRTYLGGSAGLNFYGHFLVAPTATQAMWGSYWTHDNVGSNGAINTVNYGVTMARTPAVHVAAECTNANEHRFLLLSTTNRSTSSIRVNYLPARANGADNDYDWNIHWLAVTTT